MPGGGVLLGDGESGELGLEAVESAPASGESGGEDHAVVGEGRGGDAVLTCGLAEGDEHGWSGDALVRADVQGVAGAVVEPREDLGSVGEGGGVGQRVVGEVRLPGLVG
jgi:hypothetical protein